MLERQIVPALLALAAAACASTPPPSLSPAAPRATASGGTTSTASVAESAPPSERRVERGPSAPSADYADEIEAVWNDPVFQKQFVGSYGVNADVEPRIGPEEVKILERIRPLMAEDPARAEADLADEVGPESSALLDFTLAGLRFQRDAMDEALAGYKRAIEKFPSFRRAWRNVGLIHARAGRSDEAIAAFTRLLELGGGDAYSYGLLGFAYASKEDYQPAEAAYRSALLLQPENVEWRLGLTRCVYKQKKFEDAATLLDALVQRFPDKADFWMLQAHAYLGLERPLDAAENLEIVDHLGVSTADGLFTLGDIYVGQGLPDLAEGAYARAVALAGEPGPSPDRAVRSAELLAARGAPEPAKRLSARVRRTLDARLDDAAKRRLLRLEARLGMADDANADQVAATLEEILRLDPLDGDALLLLAQLATKRNDPDRAILYLERAGGIEAFEQAAKLRLAQVLVGLSRYDDAIPHLRRAQELKPREDVARYLEQVERVARARR